MSPVRWEPTKEVPIIEEWGIPRPAPVTTRIRRAINKAIGAQAVAAIGWTRRAIAQVALSNRYGYTQPIGRRGIGVLVVGLWLTGVGMLAHQEFARTDADRLAEAAMVVDPTQYYYEVFQGDQQVGVASSGIDTVDHQFVSTTLFRVTTASAVGEDAANAAPDAHRRPESMARTVGFLSRSFVLDSVEVALSGFARPAYTNHYNVPMGVTVLPPALAPMALIMVHGARTGTEATYGMIDPVHGSTARATFKVVAESLFTVADSAQYDSAAAVWVPAHSDTVRAWRVVRAPVRNALASESVSANVIGATKSGTPGIVAQTPALSAGTTIPFSLFDCTAGAAVWVDSHGRVVAAEDASGRRVMRTAYEIAFGNWRHRQR